VWPWLFFGIVGLAVMPNVVNKLAMKEAHLTEGSVSAENYRKLPIYIYQKVYLFNITNPKEFVDKGEKPNLKQIGPYTFKSEWIKDMKWNEDMELEFYENRTFWFVPEMSEGRLDDKITTLDPILLSAIDILENTPVIPGFVKYLLSLILNALSLFVTREAHELMYDGYADPKAWIAVLIAKKLGIDTPIIDGKVGYLLGQNNTNDGNYTVTTGVNGTSINNIVLYNGNTQLKYYEPECSQVSGTNGEQFNNFEPSSPPKEITFFSPQLCRPWSLKFDSLFEDYRLQHALFKAGDDVFSATSGNETVNACYQPRGNRIRGLFEGAACQHTAPVYFSLPHFLNADPQLVQNISGMDPDPDKHGIALGVHPYLGFVTHLKLRLQVNFKTSSHPAKQNGKYPEVFYPVLWQELVFRDQDTKTLCDVIYDKMEKPKLYIMIVSGILLVIGLVALGVLCLIFYQRDLKEKSPADEDRENIIPKRESDF